MQTLVTKKQIRSYFLIYIEENLERIDRGSISKLICKVNLDVEARSKYKSLNDVFNNMITSLTNVNKNNVTLWDVTNFYRYYTQIKQQLFWHIVFPSYFIWNERYHIYMVSLIFCIF